MLSFSADDLLGLPRPDTRALPQVPLLEHSLQRINQLICQEKSRECANRKTGQKIAYFSQLLMYFTEYFKLYYMKTTGRDIEQYKYHA